jgi:hypothetical protein
MLKLHKITKLEMFATWDKKKPDTEYIIGSNLVAVKLHVNKLHKIKHSLLD